MGVRHPLADLINQARLALSNRRRDIVDDVDSTRKRPWWPSLALALVLVLSALSYLPAVDGELLFDDVPLLRESECWRGLEKVPAMFGVGEPNACTYRPGRYLTFALDYSIGGLDTRLLHISNIVYHLLTTLAVFFLFRRWSGPGAAVLMAALWALHPVHTDSVAYISGRRDIVSTLLYVLAFLQLMPGRAPAASRWRLAGRIALGLLLFALAMRTKEMAVTLPVVLVWALVCRAERLADVLAHVKRRWPAYLVLIVGAGAFFVYRGLLNPHSNMQGRWWGGTPESNFATVFTLYVRYLWLIVWPAKLIGDYFPHTLPLAHGFTEPMVLLGIGLYLGLLAIIVVAWRRGWRATAFGIGWFLITMLPVSHILPHHEIFAEHYLYLPAIGLALAGLPAAGRLLARGPWTRRLTVLVVCLVAGAYVARSAERSKAFESDRTFYEAAYEQAPRNARIIYNLGLTRLEADNCEAAVPLLLRAASYLRRTSPMSRGNLVAFLNCSERLGRSDVVNLLVREIIRRWPNEPLGLTWRGRRYLEAGRYAEAIRDLQAAVSRMDGQDPDAVAMLAYALNLNGQPQDALEVLRRWPSDHPGHCEQQVRALIDSGVAHYDEAFETVQDCLERFPNSLLLLEFRAALYFSSGRPELAEADIARMEAAGASAEALERVRALRSLR